MKDEQPETPVHPDTELVDSLLAFMATNGWKVDNAPLTRDTLLSVLQNLSNAALKKQVFAQRIARMQAIAAGLDE